MVLEFLGLKISYIIKKFIKDPKELLFPWVQSVYIYHWETVSWAIRSIYLWTCLKIALANMLRVHPNNICVAIFSKTKTNWEEWHCFYLWGNLFPVWLNRNWFLLPASAFVQLQYLMSSCLWKIPVNTRERMRVKKTDNVWAVLWKWCRSHGPPERSSRVPWGFHHRTSRPSAPIVLSAAAAVHSLTHIPLFEPPRNCSTPTFPVLNCLPEFAQTHVHWVGDAV